MNINIKFNFFKPKKKKNINHQASAPPAYEKFLVVK